jgi:hypothetical protein
MDITNTLNINLKNNIYESEDSHLYDNLYDTISEVVDGEINIDGWDVQKYL